MAPASLLQSSETEPLYPTARSRQRLSRHPAPHLKTDGNVGQSGDFIFFMNFLNSLFFLSHL